MAEKAETSKIIKISQDLTESLLEKTGVTATVEVEADQESVKINILGDDLGILIGFHGETLKSLQILLGVMINRAIGAESWYRVSVDVGSWRSSRQTSLEEMAKNAADKVKETGTPLSLPPLSPDERRLIHLFLQEEPDLISHSEGEGSARHIVIELK